MKTQTKETSKKAGVVSAKLPEELKTALTAQAEKEGTTISEVLRKKLTEEQSHVTSPVETQKQVAGPEQEQVKTVTAELSAETLLNVAAIVIEALQSNTKPSPEREYLRKIAGLQPESLETLNQDEENYLSQLSQAMKAEAVESLLLDHNSVPIETVFKSELERRTFKEMFEKRSAVISERVRSLHEVFSKAIKNAFYSDCKELYNNGLFKATYGISYEEFDAVFE